MSTGYRRGLSLARHTKIENSSKQRKLVGTAAVGAFAFIGIGVAVAWFVSDSMPTSAGEPTKGEVFAALPTLPVVTQGSTKSAPSPTVRQKDQPRNEVSLQEAPAEMPETPIVIANVLPIDDNADRTCDSTALARLDGQILYFNAGTAVLNETSQRDLNRIIRSVKYCPSDEVALLGHIDLSEIESVEDGRTLRQDRAQHVADVMRRGGFVISSENINVKSDRKAFFSMGFAKDAFRNRRVEINVRPKAVPASLNEGN